MRSATRDRPGTISFSSCRRLPATSRPKFDSPVIFPPGRAMLWTNFIPTGSGTNMNTIGIFVVASRKYGDATAPPHQDIDIQRHKFSGHGLETLRRLIRKAMFELDVVPIDVA